MRSIGIVRRMDDLGRIVIPKEVRRMMKLETGDPIEMFVEKNMICLKRYKPDGFEDFVQTAYATLTNMGIECTIYDREGDAVTDFDDFHIDLEKTPNLYEFDCGNGINLYVKTKKSLMGLDLARLETVFMTLKNLLDEGH